MKKSIFLLFVITLFNYSNCIYAQTIAIKAGHIVHPSTGEVLQNHIILIENDKIIDIKKSLNGLHIDSIIDLSDSWVTPGLMDCHVHLTMNFEYGTFNTPYLYTKESNAYRALRGANNAELFLMGGFTTVKEIGNDADYVTADIIKAIAKGWIDGPTIQYAGKIIAPYGGQTNGYTIDNEFLWDIEYIDADSKDELRKAIRKNIYYGATTIKLATDSYKYYYSQDDIAFVVKEAKQAGLNVAVHVMGGQAAKNVILGGAAVIEHGDYLDDTLLKLMKEKGTFLQGNDFSYENAMAYNPKDLVWAMKKHQTKLDRLKRAYKIGVKMVFGTDIVINRKGMNRLESGLDILNTWKEAGIPSMYILKCMTSNAAELMGMETSRGKIEVNYLADIVAFKENPLDDINNIKSVHFVMKEGVIVRND